MTGRNILPVRVLYLCEQKYLFDFVDWCMDLEILVVIAYVNDVRVGKKFL